MAQINVNQMPEDDLDKFFPLWVARGRAEVGLQRETRLRRTQLKSKYSYFRMIELINQVEKREVELRIARKPSKELLDREMERSDEVYDQWFADTENGLYLYFEERNL